MQRIRKRALNICVSEDEISELKGKKLILRINEDISGEFLAEILDKWKRGIEKEQPMSISVDPKPWPHGNVNLITTRSTKKLINNAHIVDRHGNSIGTVRGYGVLNNRNKRVGSIRLTDTDKLSKE